MDAQSRAYDKSNALSHKCREKNDYKIQNEAHNFQWLTSQIVCRKYKKTCADNLNWYIG